MTQSIHYLIFNYSHARNESNNNNKHYAGVKVELLKVESNVLWFCFTVKNLMTCIGKVLDRIISTGYSLPTHLINLSGMK